MCRHTYTYTNTNTNTHTHTCTHTYPHARTQTYLHTHTLTSSSFAIISDLGASGPTMMSPPLYILKIKIISDSDNISRFGQQFQMWGASVSTATHCNPLQHTATHYNTLQHSATHCPPVLCTLMVKHISILCNPKCNLRFLKNVDLRISLLRVAQIQNF